MSRTWHFIRHGATLGESEIRFHGRGDVPLSPAGELQVRALAPLLAGLAPDLLAQSPLGRARSSLAILREALGWTLPAVTLAELRELDFGRCEGLTAAEIAARYPGFHARWRGGGEYRSFPGGEDLEEFAARVGRAVDRLAAACPAGEIVVVAHKGVIRRALRRLFGPDHPALAAFDPPLASLTVVAEGEGGAELLQAGRLP